MAKILLTGATGYIGRRLLPVLLREGHELVCCVRDKRRFNPPPGYTEGIKVIEADLLDSESLKNIPVDIDAAYYLIHSMATSNDYKSLEEKSANNFREALNGTAVRHVIYLSGIQNSRELSDHLSSRLNVEMILSKGNYHLTTLRAGIIIGSGSASFEIIRDLVEKLPVMVTPKWLNTRSQPIAVRDVIQYLNRILLREDLYDSNFDIGGPDILSYRDMLLEFAAVRDLKRYIFTVPVMTPRLSSYWLYFVTSTSYKLAVALVDSMKIEVICRPNDPAERLGINALGYREALEESFRKIEANDIISSWKDSLTSGNMNIRLSDYLEVPSHGCFKDIRRAKFHDRQEVIRKIWRIGGDTGWYYGDWLWRLRGFMDKLAGGVGLRRGRTHPTELEAGDALDFWRVLYADKDEGRLLLFAEMKLPGEAWLEFRLHENQLVQTATFRARGLFGRLYWYVVTPFHGFIFKGLANKLADTVEM